MGPRCGGVAQHTSGMNMCRVENLENHVLSLDRGGSVGNSLNYQTSKYCSQDSTQL